MKTEKTVFSSIFRKEIQSYLDQIQSAYSKSWYEHNRSVLKNFDFYLSSIQLKGKTITEPIVTEWIRGLHGSNRTIAQYIMISRKFLGYLLADGDIVYIPLQPYEKRSYIPYIFSDDEIERIFTNADLLKNSDHTRKNKKIHIQIAMILRILYGCGLRVGETVALKVSDVDFDTGVITLKEAKNRKQRLVPMHETLTPILKQYCAAMGILHIPTAYLFQTINHEEHITVKNAKYKFDDLLNSSNIRMPDRKFHERGPCLHCLRHIFTIKSFANLEAIGMPLNDIIPYISVYLGHENFKATEQYLKFSPDLFPEELDKFADFTSDIIPEEIYE